MNKLPHIVFALLAGIVASVNAAGPTPNSPTASAHAPKAPAEQAAASAKIDLNSATEQELATLAGIGVVRSRAIVEGRPYARKDELVSREIIPASVYEKIKDRVVAHQPR